MKINDFHILLPDLLTMDYDALDWQFFREGLSIYPLYKSDATTASAALLKYAPGAAAPEHLHTGYEHIIVLRGSQEDHLGVYEKGSLVINKPGTQHGVKSKDGCVVLIIWEKPVEFI